MDCGCGAQAALQTMLSPCCLGFVATWAPTWVGVEKEKDGVFVSAFLAVTGAEQGSAWSASVP